MNRDRQPNRNVRKAYQYPAASDRRTTPVQRPSRSKRSAPPPPQEPGGKNPLVVGIFMVLILLLFSITGVYAWNLFKPSNNSSQKLSPINTPTTTGSSGATATVAPCSDPTKQKNIFVKQVPENQALEVYIPKGTTSIVALFSSRQDAWCWASRYSYNQLQGFAIYPKDGQASLVINEEDASKPNARPKGSWALVIIKGPNALVTVVSLVQAHKDVQAWQGPHGIEQANYPLTKVSDPAPA